MTIAIQFMERNRNWFSYIHCCFPQQHLKMVLPDSVLGQCNDYCAVCRGALARLLTAIKILASKPFYAVGCALFRKIRIAQLGNSALNSAIV